jgi:hypothetical protein
MFFLSDIFFSIDLKLISNSGYNESPMVEAGSSVSHVFYVTAYLQRKNWTMHLSALTFGFKPRLWHSILISI